MGDGINEEERLKLEKVVEELISYKIELKEMEYQLDSSKEAIDKLGE